MQVGPTQAVIAIEPVTFYNRAKRYVVRSAEKSPGRRAVRALPEDCGHQPRRAARCWFSLRRLAAPPRRRSHPFPAPAVVVLALDRVALGVDAARAVVGVAAVLA